jgi:CRISP-associated protein Cas1
MAVLYVTEQNACIRKTGDRLVIEKDDQVLSEVPCLKLETVCVFGNVQVTTQALTELLDHGIELALFTMSGRLKGQLTPPKAKNMPLRMAQYDRARQEAFCLELSRGLVAAKVRSSAAVLREQRRNHLEMCEVSELESIEAQADRAMVAESLESLRGLEGSAAAKYFELLGRALPPELGFEGRERRPPPDPVNALLSFGYVLVGNELQSLLDGIGFDPYAGFFHQIDYGRPSLALDLVEEFRAPLVDRFTLRLVNLKQVEQRHFLAHPTKGTLLNEEGKKIYFRAYESFLNEKVETEGEGLSFRQIFRRQAERLARAIQSEERYEAFVWQPSS